jgi:hypothetical protein
MTNEIIIRDAQDADLPFVYDSFLNYYQANSYFAKRIPKRTFMKYHAIVLNLMFDRPHTLIKIAGDDTYTIFGYIVAENIQSDEPVIHFCYVRPEYQKLGIGTSLFQSVGSPAKFEITHWCPVMNSLIKKFPNAEYNPYKS